MLLRPIRSGTSLAILVVWALSIASGCATATASRPESPRPIQVAQAAPRHARGSACGIDLLNLVPIGITHRAERARQNAIQASGAKTLLTQSLTDTSVDLMVATIQCASVDGTAAF